MTVSGLSVATATDVGCKRKNNEDSLLSLPECGLFCVADGMGGAREGQVASKAITDALQEKFKSKAAGGWELTAKATLVREVIDEVNNWIKKRAEERGFAQMGSTLVLGLFDEKQPNRGLVMHAGDSRMYCYRRRVLTQLTADHSFAAALAAQSGGTVDESAIPPAWRGVVTKAVGKLGDSDNRTKVDLDETAFEIQPGDLFIICSDGLTRMLPDRILQGLLRRSDKNDLEGLVALLIGEAKKAGGDDNISVILIKSPGGDMVDEVAEDVPPDEPVTHGATMLMPPVVEAKVAPAAQAKKAVPEPKKPVKHTGGDIAEGDTPSSEVGGELKQALKAKRSVRGLGAGIGVVVVGVGVLAWLTMKEKPAAFSRLAVPVVTVSQPHKKPVIPTMPSMPVAPTNVPVKLPPANVVAVRTSQPVVVVIPVTNPPVVVVSRTNAPVIPPVVVIKPPATNVPVVVVVDRVRSNVSASAGAAVTAFEKTNQPPTQVAITTVPVEATPKPSMESVKKMMESSLADTFKAGNWGELWRKMGPWADKLEQLEPDKAKRAVLLGWIRIWEEAKDASDLAERVRADEEKMRNLTDLLDVRIPSPDFRVSGDERADRYCRFCYERQGVLLQKMESFMGVQEKSVHALGKLTEANLVSLAKYLDGKDSRVICERLTRVEKSIAELRKWRREHPQDGSLIRSAVYVQVNLRGLGDDADEVWQKLYELVEPAGQQLAALQTPPDMEARLVNLLSLHKKIVLSRERCAGINQWRNPETGALLRDFLSELGLLLRGLNLVDSDAR